MTGQTERRVPRPPFEWSDYEPLVSEPRGQAVDSVEVPPDSGRHIEVPQGHIFRLACPDGAQVADVCVFNADDPTERFWANQTLLREGAHVTRGSRLWGTMPLYRPLGNDHRRYRRGSSRFRRNSASHRAWRPLQPLYVAARDREGRPPQLLRPALRRGRRRRGRSRPSSTTTSTSSSVRVWIPCPTSM